MPDRFPRVPTESLISCLVALATYPKYAYVMKERAEDLFPPVIELAAVHNGRVGNLIKVNTTKMQLVDPDPLCRQQPLKEAIWELRKRLLEVGLVR
jgi:hypothetical protein